MPTHLYIAVIIIIIIIVIIYILIDAAIPADSNTKQKEAGRKLKYKSSCMEIRRMWNMESMIIPVIPGPTGIATKCLKKVLKTIPGKH
jgi:hypothetical protein